MGLGDTILELDICMEFWRQLTGHTSSYDREISQMCKLGSRPFVNFGTDNCGHHKKSQTQAKDCTLLY